MISNNECYIGISSLIIAEAILALIRKLKRKRDYETILSVVQVFLNSQSAMTYIFTDEVMSSISNSANTRRDFHRVA